jgi:hypothetical protein
VANTKHFNSVELGALGLQVGGISGVHDLLPMEVARTWIAGRDYPSDVETHRTLGKISLRCLVAEADHATLVTKLQTLRNYMSPALGWCDFRLSERPNERCIARSLGFGIDIADVPWDRNVVEWVWNLERYPWWETDTDQTATIATGSTTGTITNNGTLSTYPIYTCTATTTLAGGFTFTVGGKTFTYTGGLVDTNVVVVSTDPPDVTKNTVRDFANTAAAAEFPLLAAGANAVTDKTNGITLLATWRGRKP